MGSDISSITNEEELLQLVSHRSLVDIWFQAIQYNLLKVVNKIYYLYPQKINKLLNKSKQNGLHVAIIYRNFSIAKVLILYGININVEDKYHNTPLHYAMGTVNDFDMSKVLVDNGAIITERILNNSLMNKTKILLLMKKEKFTYKIKTITTITTEISTFKNGELLKIENKVHVLK